MKAKALLRKSWMSWPTPPLPGKFVAHVVSVYLKRQHAHTVTAISKRHRIEPHAIPATTAPVSGTTAIIHHDLTGGAHSSAGRFQFC